MAVTFRQPENDRSSRVDMGTQTFDARQLKGAKGVRFRTVIARNTAGMVYRGLKCDHSQWSER